jgi:stage II sporulation protein AA (anti-sigma F factor antagonist)
MWRCAVLTEWSAESASFEERPALELSLTVQDDPDGPLIEVQGGLVCTTAQRLAAVVGELLDAGRSLTIDLERLGLLDSAGVGVLLGAIDRAASHDVDLRLLASQPAAELLDRTGVTAGARGRATIEVV